MSDTSLIKDFAMHSQFNLEGSIIIFFHECNFCHFLSNAKYFFNNCFSFLALLFLSSRAFFFRALYPHWSTVDSSPFLSFVFSRPCYLYILQIMIKETFYFFILHSLFPFYRHIYLQPASPAHFYPLNVFFVFSQIPFFYKDIDGQLSLKKTSLAFLNQPFILGLSTRKRKETER